MRSELADRLHQRSQVACLVISCQRNEKSRRMLRWRCGWVGHGQVIPESSSCQALGANPIALLDWDGAQDIAAGQAAPTQSMRVCPVSPACLACCKLYRLLL